MADERLTPELQQELKGMARARLRRYPDLGFKSVQYQGFVVRIAKALRRLALDAQPPYITSVVDTLTERDGLDRDILCDLLENVLGLDKNQVICRKRQARRHR
ncbi:MAG: hypothetical protein JSU73_12400 [candidate division WOR-3 bacterium]|nr:MAG: hypothetical protein JSU73_12400 [candidate division WOR-3 bacterium]